MKYIVDIKGEIEGDYEIIGKYEERPQGEWVEGYHDYFETLDCSLCGYVRNERHLTLNFCPNCGAKMRGDSHG